MWISSFLLGQSQEMPVRQAFAAFRSATRVCPRPSVVLAVYSRVIRCYLRVWVHRPHVCWRHKSTSAHQPPTVLMRLIVWRRASRRSVTWWPAVAWSWTRRRHRSSSWIPVMQQLDKVTVQTLKLQNTTVPFSSDVNDLDVLLDCQLTMANHVAALSWSCFFHLRRLRAIKQSVTSDATITLVHAFVSSRLDSCNSLLAGVSSQLLQRLQVVQSAGARLVTGARRSAHITLVLHDLYWLPVWQWITFRTAVLVYKCSMAWLHSTFRCIASRRQQSPGGVFDPLTVAGWLFHAPEQTMATTALLSKDLEWETVFLATFRNRLKTFLFRL